MILEHRMMSRHSKRLWGGVAFLLLVGGVVMMVLNS
jgi:hypothetical protein